MGQKIHPVGFRLGITQDHYSRWFARRNAIPQEDFKLRRYIEEKLGRLAANAGISEVRIERKADQIELEVRTARPGVVVGRGVLGLSHCELDFRNYWEIAKFALTSWKLHKLMPMRT